MTEPTSTPSPEELRDEIEQTRSEMAQTVDALTTKLDVKAQARQRIDGVRSTLSDRAATAKQSVPVPVQSALGKAGVAAAPWVDKARPYAKQITGGLVGLLVVLRIVRRHSS